MASRRQRRFPTCAPAAAEPKLDSILNEFVARLAAESPGTIARSAPAYSGSSVAVSIRLQGDAAALAGRLQAAGVLPANVLSGLVEAYVPVSLLPWVARLPGVTRVATIVPPKPDYGSVVTEGAAVHNTPNWNAFGYTGAGVKVGIIDVGFAGYSSLQGTEVPVPAAVRCYATMGNPTSNFNNCQTTTQHGVAVAETIMDEAPGVSLYLANPFSYGDLVTTAQWMVDQGVQVINHSVGWTWDGPGDGTSPDPNSPVAAVAAAVAGGAVWVNSSGNSNQTTFTGDWTDTNGNNFMEFAAGVETNDIVLTANQTVYLQMRWDDSWTAAARDLDILLYKPDGTTIAASTNSLQNGTAGDVPYEALQYTPSSSGTYHIRVERFGGTFPAGTQVQLQVFSPNLNLSQVGIGNHSVGNPAESASPGMLAVGATNWQTNSTIESYSSQGPTRDGRTKPDISATDCASTVMYGANGFCGTSQASPHVVGLAALVRQAYPSLTPAQVVSQLEAWALPRGTNPNNTWGAGLAFLQTIGGKLAFTQQPSNGSVGTPLPTQPVVSLQDSTGATLTGDNGTAVTLSLNGAGTLSCTNPGGLTAATVAGVATFAGCTVSAAGTGDTITATPSCFCLVKQSASFNVTAPVNHLAFTQQPSNGVTNLALGTQPVVTVQDTGQRHRHLGYDDRRNPERRLRAWRRDAELHGRTNEDGGGGGGCLRRLQGDRRRHVRHPRRQQRGSDGGGQRLVRGNRPGDEARVHPAANRRQCGLAARHAADGLGRGRLRRGCDDRQRNGGHAGAEQRQRGHAHLQRRHAYEDRRERRRGIQRVFRRQRRDGLQPPRDVEPSAHGGRQRDVRGRRRTREAGVLRPAIGRHRRRGAEHAAGGARGGRQRRHPHQRQHHAGHAVAHRRQRRFAGAELYQPGRPDRHGRERRRDVCGLQGERGLRNRRTACTLFPARSRPTTATRSWSPARRPSSSSRRRRRRASPGWRLRRSPSSNWKTPRAVSSWRTAPRWSPSA